MKSKSALLYDFFQTLAYSKQIVLIYAHYLRGHNTLYITWTSRTDTGNSFKLSS